MLIKAGVDISRLNREIRRTLTPVAAWLNGLACELIITSTYEGNHMASSFHYGDDAYDIRLSMNVLDREKGRLKELLGADFDVIFYVKKVHIEYDPKTESGRSLN